MRVTVTIVLVTTRRVKTSPGQPRREPSPSAPADGRRERWRSHNEARRTEFIEAAVTAIRHGGPNIGLDQVCAVARVTKPVVYRHFRDKDDLFAAVLRWIAEQVFLPRIAARLDRAQEDRELLWSTVDAYVALVLEEPQLYRFVFAHNTLGERGDFVGSMEATVAQALASMMAARLQEHGRDPSPAEPWAYGVVGMVQLSTHRWLDHATVNQDRFVDLLTDLAWRGLSEQLPAVAGA